MEEVKTKFKIGQIIRHKLFNYTGVIFDIDPTYEGTEEWYEKVAETKPPKDKPWCHILVSDDEKTTYVAEKNIEEVLDPKPIKEFISKQSLPVHVGITGPVSYTHLTLPTTPYV